jgi:hypothetical protein
VKAVSAGAADKAEERAGAGRVLERDRMEDGVQEVIGEATEPVVLILRGSTLAPTVRRGSPTGPPPGPQDRGHQARPWRGLAARAANRPANACPGPWSCWRWRFFAQRNLVGPTSFSA